MVSIRWYLGSLKGQLGGAGVSSGFRLWVALGVCSWGVEGLSARELALMTLRYEMPEDLFTLVVALVPCMALRRMFRNRSSAFANAGGRAKAGIKNPGMKTWRTSR